MKPYFAFQWHITDDPSIKNAFYDAPTVVTLFGPKNFLFAKEDCAMAAENMMLTADALGIGSCYIGAGWGAFADPCGQEILQKWAIRGDCFVVAQVLLGNHMEEKHPTAMPTPARPWGLCPQTPTTFEKVDKTFSRSAQLSESQPHVLGFLSPKMLLTFSPFCCIVNIEKMSIKRSPSRQLL